MVTLWAVPCLDGRSAEVKKERRDVIYGMSRQETRSRGIALANHCTTLLVRLHNRAETDKSYHELAGHWHGSPCHSLFWARRLLFALFQSRKKHCCKKYSPSWICAERESRLKALGVKDQLSIWIKSLPQIENGACELKAFIQWQVQILLLSAVFLLPQQQDELAGELHVYK